jgi:AraC family transcriptional regulator
MNRAHDKTGGLSGIGLLPTFAGGATAPHRLVTPPICGSGYVIEVRDYGFKTPLDAIYQPVDHHLEFTLSPQPVRGSYPGMFDDLRPIGQVTLVPAGHRFRAVNRAGVKRALICDISQSKVAAFADLSWTPADLDRATDIRCAGLETLFSVLMQEVFAPGVASEILVEATILAMMVELRRYFGAEREAPLPGRLAPWQIRLIRERVTGGTSLPGAITQLATDCGLSSRQLVRAFKATTGRPLSGHIKTVRIDQAKRLLGQPGLMIKEIAFQCGFETPAAFAAVFKKATGTTPNQYRRRVRPSP